MLSTASIGRCLSAAQYDEGWRAAVFTSEGSLGIHVTRGELRQWCRSVLNEIDIAEAAEGADASVAPDMGGPRP